MSSTLVHSGTLVDASGERPGWVFVDDGRIASVGGAGDPVPEAARSIDAAGRFVTPGFVDIHVNGGGGHHFGDGTDEALAALAAMRSHGATRSVASFVTTSIERMVELVRATRPVMERDRGLLGAHVEGPFLRWPVGAPTIVNCSATPTANRSTACSRWRPA